MVKKKLSHSDEKHGYVFGCDGAVSYLGAADLLGVSKRTVERWVEQGRFRVGKHEGKKNAMNFICRRSLIEYLSDLEK